MLEVRFDHEQDLCLVTRPAGDEAPNPLGGSDSGDVEDDEEQRTRVLYTKQQEGTKPRTMSPGSPHERRIWTTDEPSGKSEHASNHELRGAQTRVDGVYTTSGRNLVERRRVTPDTTPPHTTHWPEEFVESDGEHEEMFEGFTWLFRAFHTLNNKRLLVAGLRYKMRDLRVKLRTTRDSLEEQESQLVRVLRRTQPEQRDIGALFSEIEAGRDRFRNEEDAYDVLDEQLTSEEWGLKEAEQKLYKQIPELSKDEEVLNYLGPGKIASQSANVTVGAIEPGSSNLPASERLSALEIRRRHVEEEIAKLKHAHEALVAESDIRADVGLALDRESTGFIREFAYRNGRLKDELHNIDGLVAGLREIVESREELLSSMDQFEDAQIDVVGEITDNDQLEVHGLEEKTSVIMPGGNLHQILNEDIQKITWTDPRASSTEVTIRETLEYINQWLLWELRSSFWNWYTLRDLLYKRVPKLLSQGSRLSWVKIKELVLAYWSDQGDPRGPRPRLEQSGVLQASMKANTARTRNRRARSEGDIREEERRGRVLKGTMSVPSQISWCNRILVGISNGHGAVSTNGRRYSTLRD